MPRKLRRLTWSERLNLNPDISRGIVAILLFVVGSIATLSFFGLASVTGVFIDSLLALTFGEVRYIFPLLIFTLAILMIRDLEYDYRPTHTIGALLAVLSFNGMVHLSFNAQEMVAAATQGYGGGLAGLILGWPLQTYIGYWGGIIILAAILLVGTILLFNTSLAEIIALNKKFFLTLGWIGEKALLIPLSFQKPHSELKVMGEQTELAREIHAKTIGQPENSGTEDKEEADEAAERALLGRQLLKERKEREEAEREEEERNSIAQSVITIERPPIQYRDLPSLDLLSSSKGKPTSGDIKKNAEIIADTFKNFGIDVEMGEVRIGPTVTQYALKPAKGVKLTRITALSNDLSLALAAHPIRIEAPIPGQSLVGIEVPNQKVAMVSLRELLESPEFKNRPHNMQIALGKDVAGKVWFADLPKMPHLLIAGATGAGKTVGINTLILSLLFQNTPETLRFIMVDPKRVELTLYNGIPHLLTPVITDAGKTVNALKWAIGEMERRFDVLSQAGKRDMLSYNKTAVSPLPYIVFVIDELADLMAMAASEVEAGIIRIAQMARAVGIHLVVATQRPSVEVITGLMKANIPGRIAFSVASIIDSRTILDCPGAEKLLGRGDMLLLTAELSKPKRLQGAYVSEEEMKRVIDYMKGDEPPVYDESIVGKSGVIGTVNMFGGPSDDQDPLFEEAKRVVLESGKASASLLQRRMKVGYARAARLLDELEQAGIVGPADGAKPREVFTEHLSNGGSASPDIIDASEDSGGVVFDLTKEPEDNHA